MHDLTCLAIILCELHSALSKSDGASNNAHLRMHARMLALQCRYCPHLRDAPRPPCLPASGAAAAAASSPACTSAAEVKVKQVSSYYTITVKDQARTGAGTLAFQTQPCVHACTTIMSRSCPPSYAMAILHMCMTSCTKCYIPSATLGACLPFTQQPAGLQ
jgi:hypothetical protein